jgi:hypothetical protein
LQMAQTLMGKGISAPLTSTSWVAIPDKMVNRGWALASLRVLRRCFHA